MILGDTKAPWERADSAPALLKRLGRVKKVVLGLLQRQPKRRSTMEACLMECRTILEVSTMTVNKPSASRAEGASTATSSEGPRDISTVTGSVANFFA